MRNIILVLAASAGLAACASDAIRDGEETGATETKKDRVCHREDTTGSRVKGAWICEEAAN